jgi:putative tricarboxylic transport membrane protein
MLLLLGAIALREAQRLATLREETVAGAVVGDDTFPRVIGVALVVLGLYVLILARWAAPHVTFPPRAERGPLVGSVVALVAYYLIAPYLGYTLSTLLVATGLYRVMGGYRWPVSLLIGGATTGALYVVFRVWLVEPLPTGWLGV